MKKRLREVAPTVLVVGDMMIDHYLTGVAERVSPEAPTPIVEVRGERKNLGGAGNVIQNLLALGAQVEAGAVLGQDDAGRQVVQMLEQLGVDASNVLSDPNRPTTRKTRLMVANRQVVRFDHESRAPLSIPLENQLIARLERRIPEVAAVILSDYAKGALTPAVCQAVIRAARQAGVPVLVDPKGDQLKKYAGATLATPNRKEAIAMTGVSIDDRVSLHAAAARLVERLQLRSAVITLSEDGMAVLDDGQLTHIQAAAREVYDVCGAGDTVIATLAYCLAAGVSLVEAAEVANRAAAVVVGKVGSATATWDEIEQDEDPASERPGLMGIDELEKVCQTLRNQQQRIVFTNGCFDLLHRGHVQYLERSRKFGDVLIVGLNSDQSVSRLKGPERPVNRQEDRAAVLSALRAVDYVVVFDDDTPLQLIQRLQPHVLTKGGDYRPHEVIGRELVEQLEILPLVPDRSTTQMIFRLRDAA